MNYIEVAIETECLPEILPEILIANLSELGFESFVENSGLLFAYIPETFFNKGETDNLLLPYFVNYNIKLIPDKNWNAEWEENFKPVTIADKIHIRAPFHPKAEKVHIEIVIEPKMSFGTGHHETTSMMCELMLQSEIKNKNILDMGCGTGILSILAAKLKAKSVVAIDIDEWPFKNTIENTELNSAHCVEPIQGDVTQIPDKIFDIVLANINLNVLKSDIPIYSKHLANKGYLIISGFFDTDMEQILNVCSENGLIMKNKLVQRQWAACIFVKEPQ